MNYSIDIDVWVNSMLPVVLRKPIIKAFVKVLASPVIAYYALAATFYAQKVDEVQPYLLTNVLQDKLRTLYPSPSGTSYKCYVYNQHELTPQMYLQFIGGHMQQQFTYNIGETFTQEYTYFIEEQKPPIDYVVVMPTLYNTPADLASIRYLLNKYRPAGKTYSITLQDI
jgi:hypothetical protein